MRIAGLKIEATADGRIFIDGIRFRTWLLEKKQCPFCHSKIILPGFRYACSCRDWKTFSSLVNSDNKSFPKQLNLL